jgi:hypothetical protein
VVRYGYKDIQRDDNDFENQLVVNLAEFIQTEGSAPWVLSSSEMSLDGRMTVMGTVPGGFSIPTYCLSFGTDHEGSIGSITNHLNGDSLQVMNFHILTTFLWLLLIQ